MNRYLYFTKYCSILNKEVYISEKYQNFNFEVKFYLKVK